MDFYYKTKLLRDIKTPPLVLKYTTSTYKPINNEYLIIQNVNSFYIEDYKKFNWLKKWNNTNIYIYGNPFQNYDF